MSLTIKGTGPELHVHSGAKTLPEGELVGLFMPEEHMQNPTFLRADEDEDDQETIDL